MKASEKRREDRLLCAGLVEVRWTDNEGNRLAVIANLDDVSPGGVSLLLDCALPVTARVEFTLGEKLVHGEVRYCNAVEFGWIAGIQLGPDSHWDPASAPPDHLLDPKSIPEGARLSDVARKLPSVIGSSMSCLVLGDAVRREDR